ncbi:MAG: DNA mismatch endonuclease Vsr [Bacteroidales bacterium]|nr:DNA mismatch endonuclease Vsr [Bacteroidales bacterium]
MSHIRSANTKPELALRKALWHLGIRYRVNDKRLPGKPDIVLPKYRTAIFVHGCFWHGHKDCPNYTTPKTNTDFWKAKIERNQQRDQETWRQLEAKGWYVLIVWECEIKKARFEGTIERVASTIRKNGNTYNYLKTAQKKARELYRTERRERMQREKELVEEIHAAFPKR